MKKEGYIVCIIFICFESDFEVALHRRRLARVNRFGSEKANRQFSNVNFLCKIFFIICAPEKLVSRVPPIAELILEKFGSAKT